MVEHGVGIDGSQDAQRTASKPLAEAGVADIVNQPSKYVHKAAISVTAFEHQTYERMPIMTYLDELRLPNAAAASFSFNNIERITAAYAAFLIEWLIEGMWRAWTESASSA